MSDSRSSRNDGIQANTVKAEVLAVGQNAHAEQHRYAAPAGDAQQVPSLDELIAQLKAALAKFPPDKADEVQAVEMLIDDLVQSSRQEQVNPKFLQFKAEGFKAAADSVATFAPAVPTLAAQIIGSIPPLKSIMGGAAPGMGYDSPVMPSDTPSKT